MDVAISALHALFTEDDGVIQVEDCLTELIGKGTLASFTEELLSPVHTTSGALRELCLRSWRDEVNSTDLRTCSILHFRSFEEATQCEVRSDACRMDQGRFVVLEESLGGDCNSVGSSEAFPFQPASSSWDL